MSELDFWEPEAQPWVPDGEGAPSDGKTVTITSTDPPLTVSGILGDSPPEFGGGLGQWSTRELPNRKSYLVWEGQDLYQLGFSLIFDGHSTDDDVEFECSAIERLLTAIKGDVRSPIVTLQGPLPGRELEYVITDRSYGPMLRDKNTQLRTRQFVTLVLTEYNEASVILTTKPPAPPGSTKPGNTPFGWYTVKKGDNLKKIAVKLFKKEKRWLDIAKLNNMKTFRLNAKQIGKRIKVPKK